MAFYLLKIHGKVDPGNMKQVHYKTMKLHLSVKLCKQEEINAYNASWNASWKPRWNMDHQPAQSKKEQSNTHCSKRNHIFPQSFWVKDALFDFWFQYLRTPATKSLTSLKGEHWISAFTITVTRKMQSHLFSADEIKYFLLLTPTQLSEPKINREISWSFKTLPMEI